MPVSMTIRDIPDDVRNELAARAARKGQSLQEFMRGVIIDFAWRPNNEDWILRARELTRGLPPISVDQILDDLHADRR
jgi:plasmid stability protein